MTGPELDLLEGGERGHSGIAGGLCRVGLAAGWENARTDRGESLRPWAGFTITGNADYVSSLAIRARFLARGIHHGPIRYERYYQLISSKPRTTVWRSTR
jgi:hypothetical protein